jgi:ATP-dependent exoDNAse (exonuclease V) alpha subunit
LSDEEVNKKWEEMSDHIHKVKATIMPYLVDVTEARVWAKEMERENHTEDIATELDAALEQENMDDQEEGMSEHPELNHLDPAQYDLNNNDGKEKNANPAIYGRIDVPNEAELREKTRDLDENQRKVIDAVVEYCRAVVKARERGNELPNPRHMMVHGAAGTGKSTVIKLCAQWAQKILQTVGSELDKPYVIKTAFMGTAAANIEGQTLTSTFSMHFGNMYQGLGDRNRDMKRQALSQLQILIIDEISMVKADMLYQLDMILKEITQKHREPYGGVMVLAFGDMFQLKPVQGRAPFSEPQNAQYAITHMLEPRWELLEVLTLIENHRQGEDREFANLLNRIRVVEKGQMTAEDVALLQTRVRPEGHEDLNNASINIVCTRKKCAAMNKKYIEALDGVAVTVKAVHYRKTQKHYLPANIQADGTVGKTGFMDKLTLKVGAKVVMIWNVKTTDSLTNGQTGIVMGIVKNHKDEVEYLVVKFHQERAGKQKRADNKQIESKYPGGTKVERYNLTYTLSGRAGVGSTANLVQFPLRLAHALTAHKTQGQTYKMPMTIAVDLRDVFEAAQGYVMCGRPEKLEQLFIVDKLDPAKLYSDKKVRDEYDKMNKRSINANPSDWDNESSKNMKVCSLNCAQLKPHIQDIQVDSTLKKSDIIHLQETWIEEGDENIDQLNVAEYDVQHIRVGKGKGITTYYSKKFKHVRDEVSQNYQITKYESKNVISINVYRSAKGSVDEVIEKIKSMQDPEKANIITGDMNICARKQRNSPLISSLLEEKYKLMTKTATHTRGGHIDHLYVKNAEAKLHLYSPYYSDHDALCVTVGKAWAAGEWQEPE